jgi:Ras-related GTP-binding protein C/D
VVTKLYIATDSNPVDVHTYELCSDLVDVVVDVSYIYGTERQGSVPYDSQSASVIKLNSGMVLYLREVSTYLALVCVMREEYFARRSLLDYNIDCFKGSLTKVFAVADSDEPR